MRVAHKYQVAIGCISYLVWAGVAFLDPSERKDFYRFNELLAVGTVGLAVKNLDKGAIAPQPAVPKPEPQNVQNPT